MPMLCARYTLKYCSESTYVYKYALYCFVYRFGIPYSVLTHRSTPS